MGTRSEPLDYAGAPRGLCPGSWAGCLCLNDRVRPLIKGPMSTLLPGGGQRVHGNAALLFWFNSCYCENVIYSVICILQIITLVCIFVFGMITE